VPGIASVAKLEKLFIARHKRERKGGKEPEEKSEGTAGIFCELALSSGKGDAT